MQPSLLQFSAELHKQYLVANVSERYFTTRHYKVEVIKNIYGLSFLKTFMGKKSMAVKEKRTEIIGCR